MFYTIIKESGLFFIRDNVSSELSVPFRSWSDAWDAMARVVADSVEPVFASEIV